MAITEISGDGYALYGSVKLSVLPDWDKEAYPYVVITKTLGIANLKPYVLDYTLWAAQSPFYVYKDKQSSLSTSLRFGANPIEYIKCVATKESGFVWGEVIVANTETTGSDYVTTGTSAIWANTDLLADDDTLYLAASTPISLDGMNVIEWDGDTTDLETFNEMYKVSDTIIEPNIIQKNGAVWITSTGNVETYPTSESNYQEVSGTWLVSNTLTACGVYDDSEVEATTGLYLGINNLGNYNYISLFAYNPVVVQDDLSTVIFDLKSWLIGFTLGLVGKSLPFGHALWYSYNGTILNVLPYWDKSKYPYAVITSLIVFDTTAYKLWLFEEPMMVYSVEGSDLPTFRAGDTDVSYMMDTCKIDYSDGGSNKWEGLKNMTITANSDATTGAIVWSNYDITFENGSLYVEGSEPIPYCGQKVEQPEEEKTPVAYLYGGVQLPTLPEWDRKKYPYAVISLYENRNYKCYVIDISANEYIAHEKYQTEVGNALDIITPCMIFSLRDSEGIGTTSADGEWVLSNDLSGETEKYFRSGKYYSLFWANYDVKNGDGVVLFAKCDDPVPVYE